MTAATFVRETSSDRIVEAARAILAEVVDPEIPAISIVDLGIVRDVAIVDRMLAVEILPTFIGCPALDLIRATVSEQLETLRADPATGIDEVRVTISFAEPWTAARISARGRAALAASGFAPPDAGPRLVQLGRPAACPYCGSRRTVVENAFGPTRCRTINYCTDCRQPFEQFKDG
ncbi:MAG: 1,2-phenylacetyl-CoA epoxidase subunit PaaD [Candidatus Limnocylindrales bacterium]